MPGMALGHAVNFSRKTFAKGSCFFHVWAERPQLSCFYLSYHAIIEPQGFTAARACTSVPAVASHGIGAFLAIHEPFPPGCGLPCAGPIDQDSRHKMDSRHHVRRNGLSLGLIAVLLAGCVEPSKHSRITDSLDSVSFQAPPPAPGQPVPPSAASPTEAPVRAQIFTGQPAGRQGVGAGAAGADYTGTAHAEQSEDGVQLNFDRAAIRDVIKVILGDVLGAAYTVDPDVQGEVTLSSSAPLSQRDMLAVLESVLRSNGASLVETGPKSFQIMPVDSAIGRSQVVPLGGKPIQLRPGFGITIIPLRHISATAAAQFIQPLVAAPEDIRIDPGRNAILFSGTASERQNVLDTVGDLDIDWMTGKSIGLFPLQRATAQAVIPELQAVFAPFDPTGAEPSTMRFMPISRLNAVLAIGSDTRQIQEVGNWVNRLDHGEASGTQFYVYYLKHSSAEDLAKILNETYADASGGSSAGPSLGSASTSLSATPQAADGGEGGGVPPGGAGGAGAATPEPTPTTSGPVKIVASKANNALLIRATPEVYESIEATLQRLDTAPWQVLIEATIAEVALNDALRYGVEAFFQEGNVRVGFGAGRAPFSTLLTGASSVLATGFGFSFTPGNSRIALNALSAVTDVKVLSSPSLVVQDNSEAVLTVGDEVPIQTQNQQSTTAADAPIVSSIEYRNTGVILQVRPRINSNQTVSLEIAQEVSRVRTVSDTGVTQSDNERLTPTITQRKITSRVNVQSGQTVVLGGLIQDSEEQSRSRVPVLGDIPVVGSLFGDTTRTNQRNELIVFITPRVIRNPEDARDVSEELRSRLKSLSPGRAVGPLVPNALPPAAASPVPPAAPARSRAPTPQAPAPQMPQVLVPMPEANPARQQPGP